MAEKSNLQIYEKSYLDLQKDFAAITLDQDRILLKTVYACLGRVGEIVNPRYTDTYEGIGLTKQDIKVTDSTLEFSLITEKRNVVRRIPLARIDSPTHQYFQKNESWLTEDIINYVSLIPEDKKDQVIFHYSTRWAQKKFGKYFPEFGQHIHLLRHWRTNHLLTGQATGKPISMHIVAKMGGWKGTKVLSETYDSSVIEDYWGI
jgi:integrase